MLMLSISRINICFKLHKNVTPIKAQFLNNVKINVLAEPSSHRKRIDFEILNYWNEFCSKFANIMEMISIVHVVRIIKEAGMNNSFYSQK